MRSPFVRFTFFFVLVVMVALGAFLVTTGRIAIPGVGNSPAPQPVATAPTTPAPVSVPPPSAQSNGWPAPETTPQPPSAAALETPPDISGLDYPEVAIPGASLQAAAPLATREEYVAALSAHKLMMPIAGVAGKDLRDSFNDVRGTAKHEAIDIMAARGTPVRAIDQGNIVKLFNSKRGGLTLYQFDDSRRYCYYYAHLDRYAPAIKEGMLVRPGDIIGYVGSTGDADAAAPHLHFALSILDADRKWWKGTAVDPYPLLIKIPAS